MLKIFFYVHISLDCSVCNDLQTCWGISPESSIVPNTLEGAMTPSKEVRITMVKLHISSSGSLSPNVMVALFSAAPGNPECGGALHSVTCQ